MVEWYGGSSDSCKYCRNTKITKDYFSILLYKRRLQLSLHSRMIIKPEGATEKFFFEAPIY
jgi:hypothetical protein